MLKLLLGVVVEVMVAMVLAGLILAMAIPPLNRGGLVAVGDVRASSIIIGVLVVALAIALFRPGSAIHRHRRR